MLTIRESKPPMARSVLADDLAELALVGPTCGEAKRARMSQTSMLQNMKLAFANATAQHSPTELQATNL